MDLNVRHCLSSGIGLLYEGMVEKDSQTVYEKWEGGLPVLVVSQEMVA